MQNQGSCGSCWTFASLASFESQLLKTGAGLFDFSENNIAECLWEAVNQGYNGCDGGNIWMATNLVAAKGHGQRDVRSVQPGQPVVQQLLHLHQDRAQHQHHGRAHDSLGRRAQVLAHQLWPAVCHRRCGQEGTAWGNEFSNYDGSYTLYYPSGTAVNNNHAVTLIGWDDSLAHAGGQGAWIVKNSWGTGWGGTCGYGGTRGYFTIAYGSAGIGADAAVINDWVSYVPNSTVLHRDEAGVQGWVWYNDLSQPWGLVKLTPTQTGCATHVSVWTYDAVSDLDVYIYDAFNGSNVSGLLAQRENVSFAFAGYHSVAIDPPLQIAPGNDVYVVVKFGYPSGTGRLPHGHRGACFQRRIRISATPAPTEAGMIWASGTRSPRVTSASACAWRPVRAPPRR